MKNEDVEVIMTENTNNIINNSGPRIVRTDIDSSDGQTKCPKCGATDISLNPTNGNLRCNFCRHEFEAIKIKGMETDLTKLEGHIIGSGASDIIASSNEVFTFKCSSCSAEVVIDTADATQARCHWCRNTLSINQQIPNGAIPDVVLPFSISREIAKIEIEKFVGKRKFYAHPKFKEEFNTTNIMGVYFPYMVIDVNAHIVLAGHGEKLVRKYNRGSGNSQQTYYDADLFKVEREFDVVVEGLTIEASADKLDNKAATKTNNVINAIMPFDIENCVKWDANYLKGYTSERRDTNVTDLGSTFNEQTKDVIRNSANVTLEEYDRGVKWDGENLAIKGQQWKAAYLPVWIYSYQQIKGENKMLHYVAVNARTKETMGSVPLHFPKLFGISLMLEILSILLWQTILIDFDFGWICIFIGFIYFFTILFKYRNSNARHKYEDETKTELSNLRKVDNFIQNRKGLTNQKISGANNTGINNQNIGEQMINNFTENNQFANFIKKTIEGDKE